MFKRRNAFHFLVEKLEGKGEFGRHGRRCEDNIKIVLKEIVECIYLVQDRRMLL